MTDPDRSHAASYAARTSSPPEPDCDCPPGPKHRPDCVIVTGEPEWKGVYPGMCINPETCRGYTHCPRSYSCCE